MALSLRPDIQSPQVGQRVRVYLEDTFNHAHYLYQSAGDSITYRRGLSIGGSSGDTNNIVQIDSSGETWTHFIRHEAVLDGSGGTFEYTLHSSQVHTGGINVGANYSIVLKTINAAGSLPAGTVALRVTFAQRNGYPVIEVSNHLGLQREYIDNTITHFPAGTKIRVEYKTDIKVFIGTTLIWQGPINFAVPWPLALDYEYWATPGSPVDISGLSATTYFSEIKLTGQWYPYIPTDFVTDTGSVWSVVFHNSSHSILGTIPFFPGWEQGAGPFIDFTVPALPATAHHIQVSCQAQGGRSHGATSADLTLYTAGSEPPLEISGPNPYVVDPGEPISVHVPGYTPLDLSYEVIEAGGGSFGAGVNENIYTAPANAGTYTIRVTQGSRQVTRSVLVRPVIYVGGVKMNTHALIGGTSIAITTNFDVPNFSTTGWNVTGGSLSSKAIRSVTYTGPNANAFYEVIAQTGISTPAGYNEKRLGINVTAAGLVPTSGLRLKPAEGLSLPVNSIATIQMIGDPTTVVWADVRNFRIEPTNNNLVIQLNNGEATALLANCFDIDGGTLVWQFNSTNVPDSIDTDHVYQWRVEDRQGHILAILSLEYQNSGTAYLARLKGEDGSTIATVGPFPATATTQLKIESTDGQNFTFWVRDINTNAWSQLGGTIPMAGVQARFQYHPSIRARANNQVIVAKPTLSAGWGRWVPPSWFAEVLDPGGLVIGSYPKQASEGIAIPPDRPQLLAVTLNAVGAGRVYAKYPSGAETVNVVPLTVTPATGGSGALQWQTPAAGDFPLDRLPGAVISLSANYTKDQLSFSEINGKGTFGTGLNKNVWTAPPFAGHYTLRIQKGAETITGSVRVLPVITPAAQSVQAGGSITYTLNTNEGVISVGASGGGSATVVKNLDGTSTITFTAGPTAGGPFNVVVTTQFGTASAQVTVTSVAIPPIAISSPATNTVVQPGGSIAIVTNYPGTTTFSASAGTFAGNVYTPPTTAGTYVVTATGPAGSGTPVSINIKVPLTITPGTLQTIQPGGSIELKANISPIIEWRLSGNGTWGSITQTPTAVLTVGQTVGQYTVTLRALVAGVVTTVDLPIVVAGDPLQVTGGNSINVPPLITGATISGGQIRIFTNKPFADVTFTLSAGNGGFGTGADKNLYTAPSDAGNYSFSVHYLNQTQVVNVRVPAVIAPAGDSVATSGTKNFVTNSNVNNFGTTGWATTAGTLSSKAVRSVTLTAGTTPGNYTVTATTVEGTVTADIIVTLSGPALAVTNGTSVTVESKNTWKIETNITDGVTFTSSAPEIAPVTPQGVFTAPSLSQVYHVTVSKPGHTSIIVSIFVPLRITPSSINVIPNQQVAFQVNYRAAQWEVSPGGGKINLNSGLYTASAVPGGPHTITAIAFSGQSATATVTISPLELIISGPDTITLEPGATHEVKANFPNENLIFTAVGGHGSFGTGAQANIYTAPNQAGTYTIRVSVQGGSTAKEITVNVPLRLTPESVHLSAGGSKQFDLNYPQAQWSVTSDYVGDLGSISGTGFYQAPTENVPPVVTITVSALNQTDTAIVFFLSPFPYNPSWSVPGEVDRRVALGFTEDGSRFGSVLGNPKRSFELSFLNRYTEELKAVRQYWKDRFPEKPFLYLDIDEGELVPVYFDSKISWEKLGPNEVNYSFRVVEV